MKHESRFENIQISMEISEGILFIHYKAGTNLTIEDVKCIVQNRLEFQNGRQYPAIVFDEGIISMNKDARKYFISTEGVEGLTAAAFIQNTFFSKMLFNFILMVGNPKIPLAIFRDLQDALEWVNSKRNYNEQNYTRTHLSQQPKKTRYKPLPLSA